MLKQEYLLTKQRPNFMPTAIRHRQKKQELETAERREREALELEERQELEREAILSRAKRVVALDVPKPAGLLDEDDDSFADN